MGGKNYGKKRNIKHLLILCARSLGTTYSLINTRGAKLKGRKVEL